LSFHNSVTEKEKVVDAIQLLSDVLIWERARVEQALSRSDEYREGRIPKRNPHTSGNNGRIIEIPNENLKALQRRLLRYFLYRMTLPNPVCVHGFMPGYSYISNARAHAREGVRFVLRLDFEDAFSSVCADDLGPVLEEIIHDEIESYRRQHGRQRPLFPVKRVRWFRRMIRHEAANTRQLAFRFVPSVSRLTDELVGLILSATTYKGHLPQGAPTSPYLFSIFLADSGVVDSMREFLAEREIFARDGPHLYFTESGPVYMYGWEVVKLTIYADDITISSAKPIPPSVVRDLIDLIEEESGLRINRKKILTFERRSTAPLITGLRLTERHRTPQELDALLEEKGRSLTPRERKNIKRKVLGKRREWVEQGVGLPKKAVRRLRGFIHGASRDPELCKRMRPKIEGHIASLKAIYGNLPRQIAVPYARYRRMTSHES
jgi:hypothetical protein